MDSKTLDFKIGYILLGVLLGIALIILPLKLGIILVGGIGFTIFSFYYLEISLSMFIGLMAIVPNGLWNNMYIFLAMIFYLGIYIIQYFSGKRKGIDKDTIAPSLIVYIIFCIISFFTGFGGMDSIRVFVILFSAMVFSVLIPNIINTKEDFEILVRIITIAICLSGLFGIYQYITGIEIRSEFVDLTKSQGLSRLYSVMGNSNNDAEFWVMLLPFPIASIFLTKSDYKRILIAGATAVCVLAFLLTYSRAGYIAFVGAAGVFVLLVAPKLVPVGILVAILLIPFIPQSIINRLLTIGKDTSSTYRIYIWQSAFNIAKDYWAQGIGMGPSAFQIIYSGYNSSRASNAMHAHNVFLNIWVEVGIGGLIAMSTYIFRQIKRGLQNFFNSKDMKIKLYTAAGLASMTAFIIFSLVEYTWFYPRVMLCFWIVCGMLTALGKMEVKDESSTLN